MDVHTIKELKKNIILQLTPSQQLHLSGLKTRIRHVSGYVLRGNSLLILYLSQDKIYNA